MKMNMGMMKRTFGSLRRGSDTAQKEPMKKQYPPRKFKKVEGKK